VGNDSRYSFPLVSAFSVCEPFPEIVADGHFVRNLCLRCKMYFQIPNERNERLLFNFKLFATEI
jgi:hypothetical protein